MKAVFRHFHRVQRRLAAANMLHVLTLVQLNRALRYVWDELTILGLATDAIDSVPVYLISPLGIASPRTLFNGPYGFFDPATETGEINIPSISLSTLRDLLAARAYVSLRDILRHEYAHAIEHHHSELIHGDDFEDAFGVAHDVHAEAEFDPEHYVSPYAATCVGQEDYAETFMMFVKFGGVLPPHFNTRTIRRKWRFMARLAKTLRRHQRNG